MGDGIAAPWNWRGPAIHQLFGFLRGLSWRVTRGPKPNNRRASTFRVTPRSSSAAARNISATMTAPCRIAIPIRRRRREWPGDGVFAFPVDPRLSALESPAFWDPAVCPYVVIIVRALPAIGAGSLLDPARWTHRHGYRRGLDASHYILSDGAAFHRIWLRGDPVGGACACQILLDAMMETRLQAVSDLDRWLRGQSCALGAARPTPYQARRLELLLSILDLRGAAQVTSHEIARRLIYPRFDVGRGAAWKSSPERRRTQRLIREAEALAAGGYRALLAGRAGRQK